MINSNNPNRAGCGGLLIDGVTLKVNDLGQLYATTGGEVEGSLEWGNITGDITNQSDLSDALDNLVDGLYGKVDVEDGKGLSTNDFTTELKLKLESIDLTKYYTKTEIDFMLSSMNQFKVIVVDTLPTSNIEEMAIYLVPKTTSTGDNAYDEYLYISGVWEHIGDTSVNLDGYYTKGEVDAYLAEKVDKILGKDLSTNDFTNELKDKLEGLGEVPTKLSELENDMGFIDKAVDDLDNYYKKEETYTQQEVDEKFEALDGFKILLVTTLPTTDIDENAMYLVPRLNADGENIYDEWIYTNNMWELIGTSYVDLSGYYDSEKIDELLAGKVDVEDGKGLSTNDFTDELKDKIENSDVFESDEYYIKEQLDTMFAEVEVDLSEYSTTDEVKAMIDVINSFNVEIVATLPIDDVDKHTIYFLPKDDGVGYDEYMYINSEWELIGSTTIDLSNYYTKGEVENKFNDVNDKIDEVETKVDRNTGNMDVLASIIEQKIDRKLDVTGGDMVGDIAMGGNSITGLAQGTNDSDAVNVEQLTKAIVDGVADVTIDLADLKTEVEVIDTKADATEYKLEQNIVEISSAFEELTSWVGYKLDIFGGAMFGNIYMRGNSITELAQGTNDSDAVNVEQLTNAIEALGTAISFRGSVADASALPLAEEDIVGHVYYVEDESLEYICIPDGVGFKFEAFGGTIDLSGYATTSALDTALLAKVDVEVGKGLSANDLTDELLAKLDAVEEGATNVVLDDALDAASTNGVENQAITAALANKANVDGTYAGMTVGTAATLENYTVDDSAKGANTLWTSEKIIDEITSAQTPIVDAVEQVVNVTAGAIETVAFDLSSDYADTSVVGNFGADVYIMLSGIKERAIAGIDFAYQIIGNTLTVKLFAQGGVDAEYVVVRNFIEE